MKVPGSVNLHDVIWPPAKRSARPSEIYELEDVARTAIAILDDAADMLDLHCPGEHHGQYVRGEVEKLECRLRALGRRIP